MRTIRNKTFETNSSSTHSLVYHTNKNDYLDDENGILMVDFINTDIDKTFSTLKGKISYLVSHIIDKYKYMADDYDDLKCYVHNDFQFQDLCYFIKNKYGIEIHLPQKYEGNIEEIVEINHQLREGDLELVMQDLLGGNDYLFDIILNENNDIIIEHD